MRTIFALLLIMSFAAAQEFPTQGPATHDPTINSSQPMTYQGCVVRLNGRLALNSTSNLEYILTGERSLDSYVGQEVKIVANDVNPNDPSSDERSMSAAQPRNSPETLVVEEIEKVSDKCDAKK